MSPVTHLLLGWLIAESAPLARRERAVVAIAGIAPDVDGLGLLIDLVTKRTAHATDYWSEWHHVIGHNLPAAVLMAGVAAAVATGGAARRGLVAGLAGAAFVLHLVCDLAGSRGPDGHQYPIAWGWPFTSATVTWDGQWALNAWQNLVVTLMALAVTLALAWRRGRSPLEIISLRADAAFVGTLRQRLPKA